jgi:hypothetical protein
LARALFQEKEVSINRTTAEETHSENQRKLAEIRRENRLSPTREAIRQRAINRLAARREELSRRPHFRIRDHEPKGYDVGD